MVQSQNHIHYGMPDSSILKILGRNLKQMRLNARITQSQLAEQAGLSRSTITMLETGKGGTLSSLVAMLRCLQKLNILDSFATAAPISPLAVAKLKGRIPQRIYKSKQSSTNSETIRAFDKTKTEWWIKSNLCTNWQ